MRRQLSSTSCLNYHGRPTMEPESSIARQTALRFGCLCLPDGMKQEGLQIVLNRRKSPFTGDGFRGSLFKLLRRLQKESKVKPGGLTFHGFTRTRVREMPM